MAFIIIRPKFYCGFNHWACNSLVQLCAAMVISIDFSRRGVWLGLAGSAVPTVLCIETGVFQIKTG